VKVDHIALANLVANARVVPELLQGAVTGERLAGAVEPLLESGPRRETMIAELREVRRRLGDPGASERVARSALQLLDRRQESLE